MLRKLYLSPFGILISLTLNVLSFFHKPFMVYGFFNKVDRKFYKKTRIGSNVVLGVKERISIKDNVWVGFYSLLDGIGGINIDEGVNIASHTCIYTHSSQNAIRLLGDKFIDIDAENRAGYIVKPVNIGAFTFIGTKVVILAGTSIGKASIVGAGSVVKGDFPDYSIIVGNPAKKVGDTREVDKALYKAGAEFKNYYDQNIINKFNK